MITQPPVFIDAAYLIGLVVRRDQWSTAAERARAQTAHRRAVTTDGILSEFLAGTARLGVATRERAASVADQLKISPSVEVVELTSALMDAGIDAYRNEFRYTRLSLQDCIAILVMRERGITEALTADREFLRAGITPLMAV